jgi:hypothetical protein
MFERYKNDPEALQVLYDCVLQPLEKDDGSRFIMVDKTTLIKTIMSRLDALKVIEAIFARIGNAAEVPFILPPHMILPSDLSPLIIEKPESDDEGTTSMASVVDVKDIQAISQSPTVGAVLPQKVDIHDYPVDTLPQECTPDASLHRSSSMGQQQTLEIGSRQPSSILMGTAPETQQTHPSLCSVESKDLDLLLPDFATSDCGDAAFDDLSILDAFGINRDGDHDGLFFFAL